MRSCGKPGVGHNCLFDVAYSMAAFVDPVMPPSWVQYKVRAVLVLDACARAMNART